jgi:nucleoid DNA-binding protein/cell division protein FtsN
VDFGKIIHELLLENEIVIIPGFGAFVSEYKPAEISEDSNEIKPPSKTVLFNQQIRNNDGLLVGYVAETKRISHYDALKRIEKEREEILYKLDSGEEVELSELGTLFYTSENTIAFKAIQDENMLLDSFGLEATSISEPEEVKHKETNVPPLISEDISKEQTTEKVLPAEDTDTEKKEPTEPRPENRNEYESAEPHEAKKKKGWLWLFLILVPLIAVSVFIYQKGQNKPLATSPQIEDKTNAPIEKPDSTAQDSIIQDSIVLADQDTVLQDDITPEQNVEIDENASKFYLVGGSFSVEENADTYLKELQAKGYEAFHAGKKGRFFIIGIGTYNTFNEADQAKIEYMENNPGSEVWVWKK